MLQQNKQFLLDEDAIAGRTWQLIALTPAEQIVQQSNGTNPRIRQQKIETIEKLSSLTDLTRRYEVRIIKDAAIAPLISARFDYIIRTETNDIRCRVVEINEYNQQDLAWAMILSAHE